MEPKPNPADQFRSLGLIYQLVGEFVTPIVIGLLVDWFVKTGPWGTIIGVLLGCLLAGAHVVRLASRIGSSPPKSDPGPNPRDRSP